MKPLIPMNFQRIMKPHLIKCTKYGSIIQGSSEGIINILTPTNTPRVIAKLGDESTNKQIMSVSCYI